jgi:hypothetical protein
MGAQSRSFGGGSIIKPNQLLNSADLTFIGGNTYETDQPAFVIIQAVYDTYDIMPVKAEATRTDDLVSQPDVRFVFIGIVVLFKKTKFSSVIVSAAVAYCISSTFLISNLQVAIWSLES